MISLSKNPSASENLWRILSVDDVPFTVRYYTQEYNEIPNYLSLKLNIKPPLILNLLKKKYSDLFEINCSKEYKLSSNKRDTGYFYKLKEGLIINIEHNMVELAYHKMISKREIIKLKQIIVSNSIVDLPEPKKFYMVKQILDEFQLDEFNVKKTEVDLRANYNANLFDLNNKMVSFINNNEANGMVLFHGLPGSGKTTYLRHLISVCEARFIYLPNNLFCELSNPSFFTFILSYPNSVIILEDCEEILKPRDQNNNTTGISNLLNLSDGLLGDAMKLKIVCTFNTNIRNIDQALLRKGRLTQKYEFGKLDIIETNKLLKKLNINFVSSEPMLLADIYNYQSDNGKNPETVVKNIGY